MKKLLCVDDEQSDLAAMQRAVAGLNGDWEVDSAASGADALKKLGAGAFEVIVTDMRMPAMDGGQLLNEVRSKYPQVARIIVSAADDQTTVQRSIGAAQQFVPKPFEGTALADTIRRACALREVLHSESLRKLVGGMQSLPSLPSVYQEMMTLMQSQNASLKKAGEIVAKDMGMVTKILQWVNSPLYGLPTRISSAEQAVNLLGFDTIKSLVLSTKVFSQFDDFRLSFFSLEALQRHGLVTAKYARAIAKEENAPMPLQEDAFTAGLLHDVGMLVLAANLPDQYGEILTVMREKELPEWAAEKEVLGASHGEIGGYLLGMWGLSDDIVEAVAFHHTPGPHARESFSALTAVHVANCLNEEESAAEAGSAAPGGMDLEYLAACGLEDRHPSWRAACQGAAARS